jgi:hypothetical protein
MIFFSLLLVPSIDVTIPLPPAVIPAALILVIAGVVKYLIRFIP